MRTHNNLAPELAKFVQCFLVSCSLQAELLQLRGCESVRALSRHHMPLDRVEKKRLQLLLVFQGDAISTVLAKCLDPLLGFPKLFFRSCKLERSGLQLGSWDEVVLA